MRTKLGRVNAADDRLPALDAAYVPIPTFNDWSAGVVERSDLLDELLRDFRNVQTELDQATIDAALADAINAAALETGAIEGLYHPRTGITLSVLEGVISYTNALSEFDPGADHDLIAGQRAAFELALDVMTSAEPLSEAMIREIHRSTCAGQELYRVFTDVGWQNHELPKGEYKRNPNHVLLRDGSTHSYAPVALVPDEMHRLISQTRTAEFQRAGAVVQSAFLHHALTHIHPFADGNGRTARVLASIPLLQAASVPLVVLVDRDSEYRAAQGDADNGTTQRFVSFVENVLFDVLGLLTERLRRASIGGDPEALARALSKRRADPNGISSVLAQVHELVDAEVRSQVRDSLLPEGVSLTASTDTTARSQSGFVIFDQVSSMRITSDVLGSPTLIYSIQVVRSLHDDADRPLELWPTVRSSAPPLLIRFDEISPRAKATFKSRLESWVGTVLGALVADFTGRIS